jgi:hypothetical protein
MVIDLNNPLMNWPHDASNPVLPKGYIYDDTTTGNAPYNLQPNGKILYPVGWHGNEFGLPGLSSTISGDVGFLAVIDTPSCDQT